MGSGSTRSTRGRCRVSLTVLGFGHGGNGHQFNAWVDEFTYAMGGRCDFDKIANGKPEEIVLRLICLPFEWPISEGTSRKGRGENRELWSHARLDYDRFNNGGSQGKIETIAAALRTAIGQVPPGKLNPDDLENFLAATDFGASDLEARPDRHPR